jgi:hypothetical protein
MPADQPAGAQVNGASPQYDQRARGQRPGTVYSGGTDLAPQTTPLATSLESSGSLTGHILAQGQKDTPPPKSRTAKVVLIILLIMAVLVGAGVAAAALAGDTVSTMFDNLVNS